VCALWRTLVPSAQSVYLTLTARLQSSKVSADGSSMLAHVTKVYRIAGGDGATATDPGQCGGDGNRLFLSMEAPLHDALIAASTNKGQPNGAKPDIEDVPIGAGSYWRDSHDLGGSHAPFDISDETENGAPRGQVQYFEDPASAAAKSPLNRTDLKTLVDVHDVWVVVLSGSSEDGHGAVHGEIRQLRSDVAAGGLRGEVARLQSAAIAARMSSGTRTLAIEV
jgi:hypothetical protein